MSDGDILAVQQGVPVARTVLGACFWLEELGEQHEPGLRSAVEKLSTWFGSELNFGHSSFQCDPEAFRPHLLEYIGSYAEHLGCVGPEYEDGDPLLVKSLLRAVRDHFFVSTWSGTSVEEAGAYGLRFRSELDAVDASTEVLPTRAVLDFWVPDSTPHSELLAKALEVAKHLPVRWAAIGHSYSYNEAVRSRAAFKATYSHARRFHGFDLPFRKSRCAELYAGVRSISWVTLLGSSFAERCGLVPGARGATEVRAMDGGGVMIVAGDAPDRVDSNRLRSSPYQTADSMVRPVRIRDGGAIDLCLPAPWAVASVTAWLRRFERRVP